MISVLLAFCLVPLMSKSHFNSVSSPDPCLTVSVAAAITCHKAAQIAEALNPSQATH